MCRTGQGAGRVALILYGPTDGVWVRLFSCVVLTVGMIMRCLIVVISVLVMTEVFDSTAPSSFGWYKLGFRSEWACS